MEFKISIECEDENFAFTESTNLRRHLKNDDEFEDFEEDDIVVNQHSAVLEEDDAGGLVDATLELAVAAPALKMVAMSVGSWILNRRRKHKAMEAELREDAEDRGEEVKPNQAMMKITIQKQNGDIITIEQDTLALADRAKNGDDEASSQFYGALTQLITA